MKEKVLDILNEQLSEINRLRSELIKAGTSIISKKEYTEVARQIARTWFDETQPSLQRMGFSQADLKKYSDSFERLLEYARKVSRADSVKTLLNELSDSYQNDLIHKVEISPISVASGLNITPYLDGLPNDEKDFLSEAVKCAESNCIRASIIMGWCATIDKIHKKIASEGFDKFNLASKEMKARTEGKFKRFKKEYHINSLAELREIFDTDLLWILEYLGFIDGNEHERLRHCFTLRNHSAHPGDAPISGENLYSFYSDITKIILKNKKFDM